MLFQSLHKLTHASKNDNNKNDNKITYESSTKVVNYDKGLELKKRNPKFSECTRHSNNVRTDYQSLQPKPMPLNDKFQGEILMTVLY